MVEWTLFTGPKENSMFCDPETNNVSGGETKKSDTVFYSLVKS